MESLVEALSKDQESFSMFMSEAQNRGLLSRNQDQVQYAKKEYFTENIRKDNKSLALN